VIVFSCMYDQGDLSFLPAINWWKHNKMHESANPTVGFLEICRDCICQMVASWGLGMIGL
jgi:hypothetical protein